MWRQYVLPFLVWIFYRIWTSSWRLTLLESEDLKKALLEGQPVILAHWHGDELAIIPLVKRYSIATMTSTSKDGQLVDSVIRRLGGKTSRGSSTRGAVSALKGLVRLVRKEGHNASMAVDGPRGPIHKVKTGVFELSKLTGAPIVPMGMACSHPIVFEKSWNKAVLPKPFSRVVVYFGPTLVPPQKVEDVRDPQWSNTLAEQLFAARRHAAEKIAGSVTRC